MLAALLLATATQLPAGTDTTVTVQPGDTLTSIAAAHCGTTAAWSPIYAASRAAGTLGADPNVIYPGQLAEITCTGGGSAPAIGRPATGSAATHGISAAGTGARTWGVSYGYPNKCGDGDGDGWDVNCATRSAPGTRSCSGRAAGQLRQASPRRSHVQRLRRLPVVRDPAGIRRQPQCGESLERCGWPVPVPAINLGVTRLQRTAAERARVCAEPGVRETVRAGWHVTMDPQQWVLMKVSGACSGGACVKRSLRYPVKW